MVLALPPPMLSVTPLVLTMLVLLLLLLLVVVVVSRLLLPPLHKFVIVLATVQFFRRLRLLITLKVCPLLLRLALFLLLV